jgi:uncharacterized protein
MRLRFTRRGFLQAVVAGGVAAGATASYGRWLESQWLRISQHTIALPEKRTGEPVRVAHLSDLHASREISLEQIADAISATLALRPDVVCLTGDFITRHDDIPPDYAEVLRRLSAAVPTFASLGNHDGGAWTARHGGLASSEAIRRMLASSHIPCLRNQNATIEVRGRVVQLAGLGDLWSSECVPAVAFRGLETALTTSTLRLALSHNPDSKDLLAPHAWDVLLSGHTHGGQIGFGPLARRFAPVSDKRYIEGLHSWRDRWLHVSRGVGCLYGLRLGCRPEITLLTIA